MGLSLSKIVEGDRVGIRNAKLASERLSACHDMFLSFLGSFIGRLQQLSRYSEFLLHTQQSVTSGCDLIEVVEAVCDRDYRRAESLRQALDTIYSKISQLMQAARVAVRPSSSHSDQTEDLMMIPTEKMIQLMVAATSCVKAAGECFAKTKFAIEIIGDFEYERDPEQDFRM
jgi:hypothetical protein